MLCYSKYNNSNTIDSLKDKVFANVKTIPKGSVSTYKLLGDSVSSKAYRAIGQILSTNKDKDIPCHRIIRSDGYIGGYFGSTDFSQKKKILQTESVEFNEAGFIIDRSRVVSIPS